MDKKEYLIIFENQQIQKNHLMTLSKKFNVVLFQNGKPEKSFSEIKLDLLSLSDDVKMFKLHLSDVKNLMQLRDMISSLFLQKLSILIYRGMSSAVMPQYYLFKKILPSEGELGIFSGSNEGIEGFHDVLTGSEFDGKSHCFQMNSSIFGFDVFVENNKC